MSMQSLLQGNKFPPPPTSPARSAPSHSDLEKATFWISLTIFLLPFIVENIVLYVIRLDQS